MLGAACNPCCGEKWVCQCDCHFSGDEVAYPYSTSVEITQAPTWTNPMSPGQAWAMNKTYLLTSPAGQLRQSFGSENLLAFTDADGSVCCAWNNQIGAYEYGISDTFGAGSLYVIFSQSPGLPPVGYFGTGIQIKGNKLFVFHSYPYLPASSDTIGPWYAATARYTSANLLLNESLCRRQTASGQTEITGSATAEVIYHGPPPASQPGFTFSWRVVLPQ